MSSNRKVSLINRAINNTKINNNIKIKVINYAVKMKSKVNEYFLMKNTIDHLSKFINRFYIISVGFDDMFYGIKNSERFKASILTYLSLLMAAFASFGFSMSDGLYSLIDNPFLPDKAKVQLFLAGITIVMVSVIKTDVILGELSKNLTPFKPIYFLMNNWQSKHKLIESNYKKLAIFSRIFQICAIGYGAPILLCLASLILIRVAILSTNLAWTIYVVILIPTIFLTSYIMFIWPSFIFLLISYYKLLFDQIHDKINKIKDSPLKIINKKKENQLIWLVNQHNQVSIEVWKTNLFIRRSTAAIFVVFSLIKIISLYLAINLNDDLFRFFYKCNFFPLICTVQLLTTFIFSSQIKSAHQSYKTVNSIVCKFKMRLPIKLKVN